MALPTYFARGAVQSSAVLVRISLTDDILRPHKSALEAEHLLQPSIIEKCHL